MEQAHHTHHSSLQGSSIPTRISLKMVDYVLTHGALENDRTVLGKKEAKQRLADLERERHLLMKIADKGGIVVVAEGEALITTYNCAHRN